MKYKKEFWDTIYLVALQGLNYVAPLIVYPYLMIVLGAEKFGYIGFSFAIIQYLMLIVDFGFNLSATKRIAIAQNNQSELNNIFSATLNVKLCLLCISFLFSLFLAFGIPKFSIYSTTMMILFIMVIANAFSFVWLFQGLGKIRTISIVNIISKLLILPLTFFFVKVPSDYNKAALIQSLVYVLSSSITCVILLNKKYINNYKIKTTKKQVLEEIKASYPIFISNAATTIYTALFAIILGYFSTPVEVGKYTAVEKIMRSFCYLIFVPIVQSFYPKVSYLSIIESKEAIKLVRKIILIIIILMSGIFCILFFLSPYISIFLGKGYQGTEKIFKIMSIIPLFIAVGGIFGQLGILALGKETDKKKFQRVYIKASIVAIVSIFILVPKFQSIGASIALLLTEFTVCILMSFYGKKVLFIRE